MLSSSYGCDEFLLYDHACSHMQSIILIFKFHLISDVNIGQEHQHFNHVLTPKMGKHLDPNSQMELIGHSIVRPAHLSLSLSLSSEAHTFRFLINNLGLHIFFFWDKEQDALFFLNFCRY